MTNRRITGISVEVGGVEPSVSMRSRSSRPTGSNADADYHRHFQPLGGAHSSDDAIPGHGHQTIEVSQEVRAVVNKSYSRLGNLLATIATDRRASDPRAIAKRIEEATGHKVGYREISDYLHGGSLPGSKFMRAFAEAFSLTVEERRKVAWIYTFSKLPNERRTGDW